MAQVEKTSLASVHVRDPSIDVPGVEKLNEMSQWFELGFQLGSNSNSNSTPNSAIWDSLLSVQ